jgi:5S rRNA maturation endonuclease (ribonuclease M5)
MDYTEFYKKHVKGFEKSGEQYVGWCPFHEDEGSERKGFSMNPENGLWNCFSCRKGGNAFTFCKKMGLPVEESPDYDPNYDIYGYTGGVLKVIAKKKKDKKRRVLLEKSLEAENKHPFNPLAIDWARELRQTLWICEGEQDTRTLLKAGEQAIGVPLEAGDQVMKGVILVEIREVIIACHHDEEGERTARKIQERFPSALRVQWPEDKKGPFTVTELKEEDPYGFVETLRVWAQTGEIARPLRQRGREDFASGTVSLFDEGNSLNLFDEDETYEKEKCATAEKFSSLNDAGFH